MDVVPGHFGFQDVGGAGKIAGRPQHIDGLLHDAIKRRLAQLVREHLGADILAEVQRLPQWRDNLVANRERLACRYARSLV